MPKKPLGRPKAPPGPQYDFFDLLQRTVRRHDDPSLDQLALATHRSKAVLHRHLVGPRLPSVDLLDRLLRALKCSQEEREAIGAAYTAAHEDQIERTRNAQQQQPAESRPVTDLAYDLSFLRQQGLLAMYEWASELRRLRADAGNPSLRAIMDEADRQGIQRISRGGLAEWLTGRGMPRKFEAVEPVMEMLERVGTGVGVDSEVDPLRRDHWRKLYNRAQSERNLLSHSAALIGDTGVDRGQDLWIPPRRS
ncbi:hypothetical protein ACIBH1_45330 [Nonomuraea sp. NPDC050663]|uniref:hypothetical protein n=1 Tax=Nonomuraea sp. NPDC050663 TaxID=3364370 RepID=UPI0037985B6C